MNYPDDLFISGPIGGIKNSVVQVFDPIKQNTTERLLLNDQKRWSLLFFYPADFSFVCPTELQKMNELYDAFHDQSTEILVISRDSALVHKNWIVFEPRLAGFKIQMVSDIEGGIGRDIGLINPLSLEYERCSLIVSPEGKIAHICVVSNKLGRNIEELLRRVTALNQVLDNPETMCPESRTTGTESIKACDTNQGPIFH